MHIARTEIAPGLYFAYLLGSLRYDKSPVGTATASSNRFVEILAKLNF